MIVYDIPANPGSDNESLFCIERDGIPYDLDAEGVTKIEAYVCECGLASISSASGRMITSENDDITWSGNEIIAKLGHFDLVQGVYDVVIKIFSPTYPNGLVVAGDGYNSAIRMRFGC